MTPVQRSLTVLPGTFAVCRLDAGAATPQWACQGRPTFISVTRTAAEVSVICPESVLPAHVTAEWGWHCLRIDGAFTVDEPGVLASIAGPLAAGGLSVFAVATYDTDYVLVRDLDRATDVLTKAGHSLSAASL
jgi:uncharacterized protein